MWNARRIEIGQNGQNGQNGHSLESEGDFVFTQMSCFLTHLVSVKAYAYVPLHKTHFVLHCFDLWLRLRFVWNAHRFEIGQNGHSLDSKIEFVLTQVKCFLTRCV